MSEPSSSDSPHGPAREAPNAGHAWFRAPTADAEGHPLHAADDPFTEWLLEQAQLDATEFAVLFAVHQLNARRPRCRWIRRTQLCRSAGLDQASLTKVLTGLRQKGLVGMSRHPRDPTRACYLLIVG